MGGTIDGQIYKYQAGDEPIQEFTFTPETISKSGSLRLYITAHEQTDSPPNNFSASGKIAKQYPNSTATLTYNESIQTLTFFETAANETFTTGTGGALTITIQDVAPYDPTTITLNWLVNSSQLQNFTA